MNGLAAEISDDLPQPPARGDDALARFEPDLLDHPDDIALRGRRLGSDDKVGSAEDKDMQGMVFEHEGVIDQLAELAARRGGLDLVEVVERLGGGHVVGGGADPAYSAGDLRHVLGRAAKAKHLEPAQLGHLHVSPFHVALVIQEDVNLAVALEAGDRLDEDAAPLALGGGIGARRAFIPGLLSRRIHRSVLPFTTRPRRGWRPADPPCGAGGSWPGHNGGKCRPGPVCRPARGRFRTPLWGRRRRKGRRGA